MSVCGIIGVSLLSSWFKVDLTFKASKRRALISCDSSDAFIGCNLDF